MNGILKIIEKNGLLSIERMIRQFNTASAASEAFIYIATAHFPRVTATCFCLRGLGEWVAV